MQRLSLEVDMGMRSRSMQNLPMVRNWRVSEALFHPGKREASWTRQRERPTAEDELCNAGVLARAGLRQLGVAGAVAHDRLRHDRA